jgi:hypothetical protein
MAWWTFQTVDERVAESWARGVQWELTRMVYPIYQNQYFGNYTGLVEDIIDNDGYFEDEIVNQQIITGAIGENSSGYTISQLESSLKYQKTWDEWRNKIINDYDNPTENNLATLFNYCN